MSGGVKGVAALVAIVGLALLARTFGGARAFWDREPSAEPEAPVLQPVAPDDEQAPEVEERTSVDTHAPQAPADVGVVWSELNEEAIAALEAGNLELAVQLFEECLAAVPKEVVFANNLAEALARLARAQRDSGEFELEVPIATLQRAVDLAPQREDLARLLERWKKEAQTEEEFWTDETAHFLLSYDGERQELLKTGYLDVTRQLEEVYDEFGLAFNHYPVGHGDPKIRVVLYKRDEFSQVTGVGHWAGGVYDGVVRVPVGDYSSERQVLERVLRHELVHAFVRSYGGREVPGWLNEGLAQWLEAQPGTRALEVQSARGKLTQATLFSLEELQGSFAGWSDESRITRAYAQSLAFVDFLVTWYGEHVVFELVRACGEGEAPAKSFAAKTARQLDATLVDFREEL